MQRFLKWYKQSRKNKVIVFSIIFIVALLYSFLHRPLGLIAWDAFQHKTTKASLNAIIYAANNISVDDNEERFLNLYSHHNIPQEKVLISQDIWRYIDELEIDFLATTFLGLEELYLQSFLNKARIYMLDYMLIDAFDKIYHNSPYTKREVMFYQEFLSVFEKAFLFITKLAKSNHIYQRYAFQVAGLNAGYIWFISNFSQEQICSLDKDFFLKKIQETQQFFSEIDFNTWKDTNPKDIDAIKDTMRTIKDKLNECK